MADEKRLIEFDVIRIIAVCAVMMIHVSSAYTASFDPTHDSFLIGNNFNAISRIAVPFFIMVSGFFMLDESKILSYKKLGYKILKLIFLALIWSLYYACFVPEKHVWLDHFIYGHYHIWYLWFCAGLYLVTPILRLFVKEANIKHVCYFVILALCFQFIPKTLDAFLSNKEAVMKFTDMFRVYMVSGYIAYYLIGWLINKRWGFLRKYTSTFFVVSLLSIITIILCGRYLTTPENVLAFKLYNEGEFLMLLYSCSLFIVIINLVSKIKDRLPLGVKHFIIILSKLSLGVYLIHVTFLNLSFKILLDYYHVSGTCPKIILGHLFTVICSFLSCYIISKIRYLSKLITL